MGPQRTTLSSDRRDESLTFHRTSPAFRLETSKSVYSYDNKNEIRESRSEEPIDQLTSSKHVDHIDGNNIEVKSGEYYRNIIPTTSRSISGEGHGAPQGRNLLTEPHQPVGIQDRPVLYLQGIDQPRQPRQEKIYSEHAPPPILQTALPGRQANPDIQDIITGIVKLLNGNVNVAANTVRPLRPIQATRYVLITRHAIGGHVYTSTTTFILGSTIEDRREFRTFLLYHRTLIRLV